MEFDGHSVLHENLLQQHPSNLARLDVSIWDDVPFWPIWAVPAENEALRLASMRSNQYEALTGDLGLDTPTKSLYA